MACAEGIMLAFSHFGEPGDAFFFSDGREEVLPAGQDLVTV